MSLSNAFRFYSRFREDKDFRKACYSCNSPEEIRFFMKENGVEFTNDEFAEVITSSLFKCQTHEEALEVRQIEQAFKLLKLQNPE